MAIIILSNGHKNVQPFHSKRKHTRRNKLHILSMGVEKISTRSTSLHVILCIYNIRIRLRNAATRSTISGETGDLRSNEIDTPTVAQAKVTDFGYRRRCERTRGKKKENNVKKDPRHMQFLNRPQIRVTGGST